jgi:hypothetical protein
MIKSNVPEAIILAKVKSTANRFDMSAKSLAQLKESGVSDQLLLAMTEGRTNAKK